MTVIARSHHRYLLVLIIAWLLLVATVPVRAQDEEELPNTAWLTFDVDLHGAANVTLQVPPDRPEERPNYQTGSWITDEAS